MIPIGQFASCSPAYGRDYKSKKDLMKDWNDNKDFVFNATGQYFNKDQILELKKSGVISLNIRYKNMTQVCVIKISK